jgi:Holliday junction resolvase-like predicted endonuclease
VFLIISTLYFTAPPFYVYVLGVSSIGTFIVVGRSYWQGANRAAQGAKAEEDIGRDLASISQQGWQVEYGKMLNRGGDVDIICQSPRGKVFVIDVKSHRGTIIYDRSRLCRQMGRRVYPFEKDFLQQVKRQAVQVKEADNYRYVTPILVFSRANINIPGGQVGNVYVVARQDLRSLLLSQG